MKKALALIMALIMLMTCAVSLADASAANAASEDSDSKTQELETVLEWLTKDLTENDVTEILGWDKDTILEKLESYDQPLEYNTKEEIADKLLEATGVFSMFSSLLGGEGEGSGEAIMGLISGLVGTIGGEGGDLSGLFGNFVEPVAYIFDGTEWDSGDRQLTSEYQGGKYVVTVTGGESDETYTCVLDEYDEGDNILSRLTAVDEDGNQPEANAVTFVFDPMTNELTWTDANGDIRVFEPVQQDDGAYEIMGVFDGTVWQGEAGQIAFAFDEGTYIATVTEGETETTYTCDYDEYTEGDVTYMRLTGTAADAAEGTEPDTFVLGDDGQLVWHKADGTEAAFEEVVDELSMNAWYVDGKELNIEWNGDNNYTVYINGGVDGYLWTYECTLDKNTNTMTGTGSKEQYGDAEYTDGNVTFVLGEDNSTLTWTDDKDPDTADGVVFDIVAAAFTHYEWYSDEVDSVIGFFSDGDYGMTVTIGEDQYEYVCAYDAETKTLTAADPKTLDPEMYSDIENYKSIATFELVDDDHMLWRDDSGVTGVDGILLQRAA